MTDPLIAELRERIAEAAGTEFDEVRAENRGPLSDRRRAAFSRDRRADR